MCDESGLAQNIHYGDVLIKYGEVLDVGNEPLAYINSDKIVTAMKNSYLQMVMLLLLTQQKMRQ